jgi:transcriptional regulator with XRE-family HTH domain
MRGRSSVELSAARRALDVRRGIGRDVARLREDAGLSRAAVGRAARVSASAIGRIETAAFEPDLETLLRVASVLGNDVSVRLFPSGAPIRDRFQAPMLEAFLAVVDANWDRHVEVPVTGVVRGVIDCVLAHPARPLLLATEVQSEVRRAEEVLRRSSDKAGALREAPLARRHADRGGHDALEISRVLLLRSTSSTRAAVRDFSRTFAAAYPARVVDALAALRDPSRPWPGSAIVWVHLHGRTATVMAGPPRAVALGRS